MVRLTLDEIRDFETADYRVGVPLTYGIDNWQYKLAVYHLSSHLGDEFAIAHPGSLVNRINYVRDEVVLGASYYPALWARLYARSRLRIQHRWRRRTVGIPIRHRALPARSDRSEGTPFFAINGHLREELDFGGDLSTQLGWLWRGNTAQVMRLGLHYFNGKSSQYQTFNQFEQQIGVGFVVRLLNCHSERSDEPSSLVGKILRFAQDDNEPPSPEYDPRLAVSPPLTAGCLLP